MFITGWTDKDGNSLCYESPGMYVSPCGEKWGNMPFTKEQKKIDKVYSRFLFIFDKVTSHLTRTNRSILEEIELIKQNKSTLPRYCKDWLLKQN